MSLGTAFKVVGPYLAVGVIAILIASVLVFMARRRIGTWLVRVTSRSDISDAAARLALLVAFSITLLLVALEGVPTLAFAVGIAVHPMEAVLVVAGTVLGTVLAARPLLLRRLAAVVTLVLLATVLVASLAISGWFYDASWDGNATYQVATVELARGWNPLRAPTAAMKLHFDEQLAFEHAPKGVWIRRALIYTSTGRLEQAKADNILLIAAGLSAWLALLLTAAPNRRKTAILGSMLAALNPVSVQQFSTFLFDGQVSSLLVLFVAYAGMAFTSLASWPVFFSVAAVIVMLSTAKFTGLVFAGILAIGLLIGPLGRLRTPKGRSVLASAAIALVIGAFAMGFNPYVTNTLDHASPFYPVMGPNALDIISDLQPPNFAGKGSAERLALSLFSKSATFDTPTQLKLPFSVDSSEIRPYLGFQTPVAGFGPWFGGALLVSALLAGAVLLNPGARYDAVLRWALFAGAVVLLSAIMNPEAWWARYSPQLWLGPVIVGLTALYRGPARWHRQLGAGLCAVLILDAAFVGAISTANAINARLEINMELHEAEQWPKGALLQQGEFAESWVKLSERGIEYTIVSESVSLADGQTIPYLTATIAPAP